MDVYYSDWRFQDPTGFCVYNCTRNKYYELLELEKEGKITIIDLKPQAN